MKVEVEAQVVIQKVDLKKLREKAGLSQEQLAKAINTSYSHISNLETGKIIRMKNSTWKKIQKALDNK